MPGDTKYGELVLNLPESQKNIARYIWTTFTKATQFRLSDFPTTPFVIEPTGAFAISESFQDFLDGQVEKVADRYDLPDGLEEFRQSEPLACAFYLLNSLHESLLPQNKLDKYGRYPYPESIQYAHDLMEVDYVREIFEGIYKDLTSLTVPTEQSKLMWSHDIDYLYSAWKSDLILALRNSRYRGIPGILWKALTSPARWNNIDELLELEKEFDIRSTFFWLTEQGKSQVTPSHSIDHADYHFRMAKIQKYWDRISKSGSMHGLHKSAFPTKIEDELQKLPDSVVINRNHFLRFQLPDHYDQIENSGLKSDASVGFPEHFGFRNSFGSPFQPYNLPKNRPYRFIEYPLHLMDATFLTYLNDDLESMTQKMTDFVHRHDRSCTISILLHNSYFDFHDDDQMDIWYRFFKSVGGKEWTLPISL